MKDEKSKSRETFLLFFCNAIFMLLVVSAMFKKIV